MAIVLNAVERGGICISFHHSKNGIHGLSLLQTGKTVGFQAPFEHVTVNWEKTMALVTCQNCSLSIRIWACR